MKGINKFIFIMKFRESRKKTFDLEEFHEPDQMAGLLCIHGNTGS